MKGRATQSQTFPNKKEAQRWASSVESSIRENRYFPQAKAARTPMADVIERYRDSVLKGTKREDKASQHLNWWKKRLEGKTIAEVTPDIIATARDELAAGTYVRGKAQKDKKTGALVLPKEFRRSGATVNRYLGTLSHVFTTAIKEWRLSDRNAVADISKKKESRWRVRFLSDFERESLLTACAKSDWPDLRALVLLAISTGARRGGRGDGKVPSSNVDVRALSSIGMSPKVGVTTGVTSR